MKPPEERHIKGNVVIDYVRMIRANPDLPWSEHLLPEDLEIIDQYILPLSWYPIGFFQRTGFAVFNLLAGGNAEVGRIIGRSLADRMHADYPGLITRAEPRTTLEKYIAIQRTYYSFHAFDTEDIGPRQYQVKVYYQADDLGMDAYLAQVSGTLARMMELSGCSDTTIDIQEFIDGDNAVSKLNLTW